VGAILIATEGGRCVVGDTDSGFNQSCDTESQGKCIGGETTGWPATVIRGVDNYGLPWRRAKRGKKRS
jgi:hypothetical protein